MGGQLLWVVLGIIFCRQQAVQGSWTASVLRSLYGQHADVSRRSICEEAGWRDKSLKLVREIPFAGLFADLQNITKFEASGLEQLDGKFYVVFDSLRSLGYIDDQFQFRAKENRLIGEAGEESQWEGITYRPDTGNFLLIQESHSHNGSTHPLAEEVKVAKDLSSYEVVNRCRVDFELSHENKGLESIHFHDKGDKGKYLLGLCEGNHCVGGHRGRDPGNGLMIVSKQKDDPDNCTWAVDKKVKVPETAYFTDYSGMAFDGDRIGITSQEDSAIWVGTFDFDKMEFTDDPGEVYHFPRDSHCDMVYCNIEGIKWLDRMRIIVTSDRAKADQPYQCVAKDQSVHVFVLPHGAS
ncbi:hypothetical protein WJX72_009522 [[Myrmecia] bisecta]|uniref:Uncharacterized protein n=1 Tax=[Myrmecia] bisecta TaxID=41462 RepID=A0AAW1QST6_9CHLO